MTTTNQPTKFEFVSETQYLTAQTDRAFSTSELWRCIGVPREVSLYTKFKVTLEEVQKNTTNQPTKFEFVSETQYFEVKTDKVFCTTAWWRVIGVPKEVPLGKDFKVTLEEVLNTCDY